MNRQMAAKIIVYILVNFKKKWLNTEKLKSRNELLQVAIGIAVNILKKNQEKARIILPFKWIDEWIGNK
jgi:hypothetical protein